MTPDEIAAMTGQANFQASKRLVLNEVLLNGDPNAGSYRKRIWIEKGDGKPEELDLGRNLNVVFLKIRRKLVERGRDGSIFRTTNEHDTVNDVVTVYEEGKDVFTGGAKEARIKYEGLRTVQVVYALLILPEKEPELVRISIKGASLGSEAKPKDVPDFYQYVSMFDNEPITARVTQLGVIREEGRKPYYAMTFAQGPAVEKLQPVVLEKLQFVHENTKARKPAPETAIEEAPEETPVIQTEERHPLEDEFNPDEIPF